MTRRVLTLGLMICVVIVLFYASRYWPLRLWGRNEFFGLPPQGGLIRQWLRGTQFAPFELLIWGIGSFLILTGLQKLLER
ncbi:MAG: hypothetical protein AAGE03_17000 [Pseudomonadota bacterium]